MDKFEAKPKKISIKEKQARMMIDGSLESHQTIVEPHVIANQALHLMKLH